MLRMIPSQDFNSKILAKQIDDYLFGDYELMPNNLYNGIRERLFYTLGKRPETAGSHDIYMALCYAVRDQMMTYHLRPEVCNNEKEVAYLSAEFLI